MRKYNVKKAIISLAIIAALGIFLSVWFLAKAEIYLKPMQREYPVGTITVDAAFKNIWQAEKYFTGSKYVLEKLENGQWIRILKDAKGAFFTDELFSPVHGTQITFDLTKYCDGLAEGEYRISVTLTDKKGAKKDVYCHFTVH